MTRLSWFFSSSPTTPSRPPWAPERMAAAVNTALGTRISLPLEMSPMGSLYPLRSPVALGWCQKNALASFSTDPADHCLILAKASSALKAVSRGAIGSLRHVVELTGTWAPKVTKFAPTLDHIPGTAVRITGRQQGFATYDERLEHGTRLPIGQVVCWPGGFIVTAVPAFPDSSAHVHGHGQ